MELVPDAFKECEAVFKSTADNDRLPIYLGVEKSGEYLLSIGREENPLRLDQDKLFFLYESLSQLISSSQKDLYGVDDDKLEDKLVKSVEGFSGGGVNLSKHVDPESAFKRQGLEDLLEKAKQAGLPVPVGSNPAEEVTVEDLVEAKEQLQEVSDSISDMKELYDSMTDEEKAEFVKEKEKERQKARKEKLKSFEELLLGDVKVEKGVEYNLEYFREIFKKHGAEYLREELAKIPKDSRDEVIKSIVEEYKDKQQGIEN